MFNIHNHNEDLPLGKVFYVDLESGIEGPRTVVVGGIHGDESQARLAVSRLPQYLVPHRGSVRVILNANPLAIAFSMRYTPIGDDLNRCFAENLELDAVVHARGILKIIQDFQSSFVIDVHETFSTRSQRSSDFFLFEDPTFPILELPTLERRDPTQKQLYHQSLQGRLCSLGIKAVTVEGYSGNLSLLSQQRGFMWVLGSLLQQHDPSISIGAVKYR